MVFLLGLKELSVLFYLLNLLITVHELVLSKFFGDRELILGHGHLYPLPIRIWATTTTWAITVWNIAILSLIAFIFKIALIIWLLILVHVLFDFQIDWQKQDFNLAHQRLDEYFEVSEAIWINSSLSSDTQTILIKIPVRF